MTLDGCSVIDASRCHSISSKRMTHNITNIRKNRLSYLTFSYQKVIDLKWILYLLIDTGLTRNYGFTHTQSIAKIFTFNFDLNGNIQLVLCSTYWLVELWLPVHLCKRQYFGFVPKYMMLSYFLFHPLARKQKAFQTNYVKLYLLSSMII